MLCLINDILDFSKIESGKLSFEAHPFNLLVTLEDIADQFSHLVAPDGPEILLDYGLAVPQTVVGDSGRIRQVLNNFVGNAVKFTKTGTILIVVHGANVTESEVELHVSVKDTGIGIGAESLGKLFQPFMQADSSTTRKYGGTGLGLSITKSLVERMGGTVGADSEVGVGSNFWFTLKLPIHATESLRPAPTVSLRGIRLLVAARMEQSRAVVLKNVACLGMSVTESDSGPATLQALLEASQNGAPIQIALLDWDISMGDGESLASQIKLHPLLKDTVLVLLSPAKGKELQSSTLREAGFSGHLRKPMRQGRLFDVLELVWQDHLSGDGTSLITRRTIVEPQVPTFAAPAVPVDLPAAQTLRVLVVEDNTVNQEIAAKMLMKMGCRVDVANDGGEALTILAAGHYDLIFMDCMMPQMDGFEATIRIRRDKLSLSPIIALTANAMAEDREKCLAVGMDDYMSKPVSPKAFRAALERWGRKTAGA